MKKIIASLLLLVSCCAVLPAQKADVSRYLQGAVPVVDGYVQFDTTVVASGRTRADIYQSLIDFTEKSLVQGPEQLSKSRITEASAEYGLIVASIEEYLYFKRTNWVTHRVRFYYQLIMQAKDGGFTAQVRRLHYKYDDADANSDFKEDRPAEKWITDDEALSRDGKKLTRIAGKFRRFTIDRVEQIFKQAAEAARAK